MSTRPGAKLLLVGTTNARAVARRGWTCSRRRRLALRAGRRPPVRRRVGTRRLAPPARRRRVSAAPTTSAGGYACRRTLSRGLRLATAWLADTVAGRPLAAAGRQQRAGRTAVRVAARQAGPARAGRRARRPARHARNVRRRRRSMFWSQLGSGRDENGGAADQPQRSTACRHPRRRWRSGGHPASPPALVRRSRWCCPPATSPSTSPSATPTAVRRPGHHRRHHALGDHPRTGPATPPLAVISDGTSTAHVEVLSIPICSRLFNLSNT
ncbi:hypothetical protein HBB16_14160 [Pseudonocardia sp. MCCB 268]|nr:hypothetical protein [Pseudonocardia cytotoxica]